MILVNTMVNLREENKCFLLYNLDINKGYKSY